LVWSPFLASSKVNDKFSDWSLRANYASFEIEALQYFHEIPYWATRPDFQQMKMRGSHFFLSNPETDVLTPISALYFFFEFTTAVKIGLLLHISLGVFGLLRIARYLSGESWQSPITVPLFALLAVLALANGGIVAHILVGHIQFQTYFLFPLILDAWLRGWYQPTSDGDVEFSESSGNLSVVGNKRKKLRKALLQGTIAGTLLAVGFLEGGAHIVIHIFVIIGLVGLFLLITGIGGRRTRRWPEDVVRIGQTTMAMIFIFVLLAAIKLFPALNDFGNTAPPKVLSFTGPIMLIRQLFTPIGEDAFKYPHEITSYVGYGGCVFFLAALFGRKQRAEYALLFSALILFLLAFWPDSWVVLHNLPILKTQGATRFRLVAIGLYALCSFIVLIRYSHLLRGLPSLESKVTYIIWAVAFFTAGDLFINGTQRYLQLFSGEQVGYQTSCVTAPNLRSLNQEEYDVQVTKLGVNSFSYNYKRQSDSASPYLMSFDIQKRPNWPLHLQVQGGQLSQITVFPFTGSRALTPMEITAVQLNKPDHGTIVISYEDPVAKVGLLISIISWIGLAVIAGYARLNYRANVAVQDSY